MTFSTVPGKVTLDLSAILLPRQVLALFLNRIRPQEQRGSPRNREYPTQPYVQSAIHLNLYSALRLGKIIHAHLLTTGEPDLPKGVDDFGSLDFTVSTNQR